MHERCAPRGFPVPGEFPEHSGTLLARVSHRHVSPLDPRLQRTPVWRSSPHVRMENPAAQDDLGVFQDAFFARTSGMINTLKRLRLGTSQGVVFRNTMARMAQKSSAFSCGSNHGDCHHQNLTGSLTIPRQHHVAERDDRKIL